MEENLSRSMKVLTSTLLVLLSHEEIPHLIHFGLTAYPLSPAQKAKINPAGGGKGDLTLSLIEREMLLGLQKNLRNSKGDPPFVSSTSTFNTTERRSLLAAFLWRWQEPKQNRSLHNSWRRTRRPFCLSSFFLNISERSPLEEAGGGGEKWRFRQCATDPTNCSTANKEVGKGG